MAITDKVAAAKARKRDQETIGELEEIINNLISDKNDLVRIAQAYEQELAARRISKPDVEYMTRNVMPILKQLIAAGVAGADADSDMERAIDAIASLLSVETVNILQLVGFNFRRAVGEPLTQLIARLISSRMPFEAERNSELQALQLRRELAYVELAQDPEAHARLKGISEDELARVDSSLAA